MHVSLDSNEASVKAHAVSVFHELEAVTNHIGRILEGTCGSDSFS